MLHTRDTLKDSSLGYVDGNTQKLPLSHNDGLHFFYS